HTEQLEKPSPHCVTSRDKSYTPGHIYLSTIFFETCEPVGRFDDERPSPDSAQARRVPSDALKYRTCWRFSSRNATSCPSTARRTRSIGAACRCCCRGAAGCRRPCPPS